MSIVSSTAFFCGFALRLWDGKGGTCKRANLGYTPSVGQVIRHRTEPTDGGDWVRGGFCFVVFSCYLRLPAIRGDGGGVLGFVYMGEWLC